MNKYRSKILIALLSIILLANNVQAESTSAGLSDRFPNKIAMVFMGVMAAGLSKFAYGYIANRNMQMEMKKKLELSFSPEPKHFSFQEYRSTDYYSDGKFWPTAQAILYDRKTVYTTLMDDIMQVERIYIDGKPCTLNNIETTLQDIKISYEKENRKKLMIDEALRKIKVALKKEEDLLYATIQKLSNYTDAYVHIKNLINNVAIDDKRNWANNAKTNPIEHSRNIKEHYNIFSKFTIDQIKDFTQELTAKIQEQNTWWKKLTCPRYVELSLQYWEFVQRYVRVHAFSNVVHEFSAKN